MNFLSLVQELHRECGVAGSTVASVVNQTGEAQRLVSWVRQAWQELQLERENWWFLRKEFSLLLASGDSSYSASDCTPAVTDLGKWKTDSMRAYKQSVGVSDQMRLSFKDYDEWRDIYALNAQTNQRPTFVTVKPNMDLAFGPIPDDIYVVTGDYYAAPGDMVVDIDEPTNLPAQFHMLIVFRAGMKYAAFESASEVYSYCKDRSDFYTGKLELNQLGAIERAAPLA